MSFPSTRCGTRQICTWRTKEMSEREIQWKPFEIFQLQDIYPRRLAKYIRTIAGSFYSKM
jgi:hypothetical protein